MENEGESDHFLEILENLESLVMTPLSGPEKQFSRICGVRASSYNTDPEGTKVPHFHRETRDSAMFWIGLLTRAGIRRPLDYSSNLCPPKTFAK